MGNTYHIVLSHHGAITPEISGAVQLVARDFFLHSATQDQTTIYGKEQANVFPDIRFCGIRPSVFRLCTRATDYARQVANKIPNKATSYVEIHNRPRVFNILRKRLPLARLCLYLHNDPEIIKGLKSLAERKSVLSRADAIICVSEYVRKMFLADIVSQHEKVHVINNGMDMQGKQPPAPDAKQQIVFAGRIIPEKGALLLAQALGRVLPEHPEWSAVFIGGSRHAQSGALSPYERQTREAVAHIQQQVLFPGHIPNAEVQSWYGNSRIAVIPSIEPEAFPKVALEAMANGAAVVGAATGGLIELIDKAGIVIDPTDEHAIDQALEKLINAPEYLGDLRLQGYARANAVFDIRRLAGQLDALRETIMSTGK